MLRLLAWSALAAALYSVSLRYWGFGYLALLATAVLCGVLLRERRPWRGALAAAIAWIGLGLPTLEGAGLRLWWALPALLGFLGLGWALAGALTVALRKRLPPAGSLLAMPIVLTATEFIVSRRWLLGDAAAGLLVYTQADTPLRNLAAWGGPSLVSFGTLLVGLSVHAVIFARWRAALTMLGAIALLVLLPAPGSGPSHQAASINVAAIQGAQGDLARLFATYDVAHYEALFSSYAQLAASANADGVELMVMGETVLPRGTVPGAPEPQLAAALSIAPVTLVGAHEGADAGWFNSAFVWRGDHLESVYRKQALVPIIEGDYAAGDSSAPVMLQGTHVGLGICLDSAHATLARSTVQQGAEILVYITDDTFAGSTATPRVHLRTAAIRAAETGRSVVFANESGPSALFDQRGNMLVSLAQGVPGFVSADLPITVGITPFVALGEWFGWLSLAVLPILVVRAALAPRPRMRNE